MTRYDDYGLPVGAYTEQSESLTAQAGRLLRALYLYRVKPVALSWYRGYGGKRRWSLRRLASLANALVLVWWAVLYWGERGVFDGAVGDCGWEGWEDWEPNAQPHHLIFIADPQLIDPHTYPGRPWPLNPLTYMYTDLYLRRTFSRLQTVLHPDTVFFLGDLFDGGREWATRTTTSPEARYRKYGEGFWLGEYKRFSDIFFAHWNDGGIAPGQGQPGRKMVSSLPGNHDLGFARGVQLGVRDRFNAYFGDGNRIDVIANHTFVSIDSVSLSAMGQDSPQEVESLWRPTRDFLARAKEQKQRLIQRELRRQRGEKPYPKFKHTHIDAKDLPHASLPHHPIPSSNTDITPNFPTILLSHIPLYRPPGTPCGPLRERHPPTPPSPGSSTPVSPDPRNAISVSGGYQYQNVLHQPVTVELANALGDIGYAFSGDDHDFCEVLHRGYASSGGGIRERTVKSTSWAMGVRRPGVGLVSLWNPVDAAGRSTGVGGGGGKGGRKETLQFKLCLLPDQIGTFLRYGLLAGVSVVLLGLRAALAARGVIRPAQGTEVPLLPTAAADAETSYSPSSSKADKSHSANSSSDSDRASTLHARSRTTSTPGNGGVGYTFPLVQHAGYFGPPDHNDDSFNGSQFKDKVFEKNKAVVRRMAKPGRKKTGWALFWAEFGGGLVWVGGLAGGAYGWLVWRG